MPEPGQNEPIFSVSEINEQVKDLLDDSFPPVWIEGEITGFTPHRSGHWYFTIKDENAELSCTMFQSANRRLTDEFKNGNQVLLKCNLSIYKPRGQFQGNVSHMEHAGEGKLRREFEELRNRLQEEGLFDDELKIPIPRYPKSIAIISSPEGAAIRDMYANIGRRYPAVRVILVPSLVQGVAAPLSIVEAFAAAEKIEPRPDTLIVTRGGGSLEDLAAFNDERVARAIVACPIPVISAIGHETDFTIADFVSDRRAPTPSTAAEIATPDKAELGSFLVSREKLLIERLRRTMDFARQRVESTRKQLSSPELTINWHRERLTILQNQLRAQIRTKAQARSLQFMRMQDLLLRSNPQKLIGDHDRLIHNLRMRLVDPRRELVVRESNIDDLCTRLISHVRNLIQAQNVSLTHFRQLVERANPMSAIETSSKSIGRIHERLKDSISQRVSRSRRNIAQIARTLHAVSPLATLDRGFAVVAKPDDSEWGELVSKITQVQKGDQIRAHISDGEIDSIVSDTRSR